MSTYRESKRHRAKIQSQFFKLLSQREQLEADLDYWTHVLNVRQSHGKSDSHLEMLVRVKRVALSYSAKVAHEYAVI